MAVKGPNHQMRTRIRGLTVLFALIGFGLVGVRLLYMQVFNHDFYVQQATALQTRDTFITPNRGKIYDANMQVLAESAAVERITISPKAVVDEDKVKKGISAETQQQTLAQILSETLDVDYDTVTNQMVVSDVVFNDPNTLFLQEAAKRGAHTINGLGMLVNQGALNFTLWTGEEAPIKVMTDTLKNEFGL